MLSVPFDRTEPVLPVRQSTNCPQRLRPFETWWRADPATNCNDETYVHRIQKDRSRSLTKRGRRMSDKDPAPICRRHRRLQFESNLPLSSATAFLCRLSVE